jgi:hypothetical protein
VVDVKPLAEVAGGVLEDAREDDRRIAPGCSTMGASSRS